jgi:GTP-binding protein Era
MPFKSGFATIIGRPNVGKSTLVNALAGGKISIISEKPQTTRNVIRAIINREDCQIVLIDTPGIHKPKTKLGEYMASAAVNSINEVDAVVYIVEAVDESPGPGDMHILEKLKQTDTPVILAINKIDLAKKEKILSLLASYKEQMDFKAFIPISALNKDGTEIVIEEIKKLLPEGPRYFPEDMLTDQPERMLVSELIREKILLLVSDEVPHGVGIEIISFKEREDRNLLEVQANIYCEKDSHKGILIGKGGTMLKKIGTLAREEIESILGVKLFLQLWVKVKPGWRNNKNMLQSLGYVK